MNLELTTIIGMLLLSFFLGGFLTHLLKKKKIIKLKEELLAYKRSADGLWELNEEIQKKTRTKKESFRDDTSSERAVSITHEFKRDSSIRTQ